VHNLFFALCFGLCFGLFGCWLWIGVFPCCLYIKCDEFDVDLRSRMFMDSKKAEMTIFFLVAVVNVLHVPAAARISSTSFWEALNQCFFNSSLGVLCFCSNLFLILKGQIWDLLFRW